MKKTFNRFNFLKLVIFLMPSILIVNNAFADLLLSGGKIFNTANNQLVQVGTLREDNKVVDNNGNLMVGQNIILQETGGIYKVDSQGNLVPDETKNDGKDKNGNPVLPFPLTPGGTGNGGPSTGGSTTGGTGATSGNNIPTPQAPTQIVNPTVGTNAAPANPASGTFDEFYPTGISGSRNSGGKRTARDLSSSVKQVTGSFGNIENDLMDSFDGWSQLYRGQRNSILTTDPYKLNEAHPELFFDTQVGADRRTSLGKEYNQQQVGQIFGQDIGVDDEILKTSMAVYQPIRRMQKDFLEDQAARDAYLDNALTVRGIAIMTMGFLDKTVGAGLTSIQQQADQETVQNLLKQISWTTSKMANPDRAQVYRDTDEKLEACLENAFKDKAPKVNIQGLSRKVATFECDEKCGTAPAATKPYRTEAAGNTAYKEQGNGTYAYCVCCAETKSELNKLTEDGEKKYSLAERLFIGTKKSTGQNASKIEKALKWFRNTYGDVNIESQASSGDASEPSLRYVFAAPKYSVRRLTAGFRDGCKEPENPQGYVMDNTSGEQCGEMLPDFNLEWGICPALINVLQNWEKINNKSTRTSEHIKMWTEASLGTILTGDDIMDILNFNGSESGSSLVDEPTGAGRRWIRNFCNASAFTALVRFHTNFSQIINDHITLNQQMTSIEKGKILELISRVSSHIALAEKDMSASYPVEGMLAGLQVKSGREAVGKQAAIAATAGATQARSSELAGLTTFGLPGVSNFFDGGTATARKSDPISQTLESFK